MNNSHGQHPENPQFAANLRALHEAGIREPTAARLARLAHVTPEYITAHVEQANAQGFELGTAIYRIQHAWPLRSRQDVPTVNDRIRHFLGEDEE